MTRVLFLLQLAVVMCCLYHTKNLSSQNLTASIGNIPPHSIIGKDGRTSGSFVEVVRAIDRG